MVIAAYFLSSNQDQIIYYANRQPKLEKESTYGISTYFIIYFGKCSKNKGQWQFLIMKKPNKKTMLLFEEDTEG